MKNLMTKFAASIVVLAAALSCSEAVDDLGYTGEDNYITKLAITVDNITYNAAIQDDEITLTVPENISLDQATVEYTISEKATISPDPAEKSDWDVEEQFVVTSYNESRRAYVYKIEREGLAATGNIILNSQAELDAFTAEGYSTVAGNLILGKTASDDDPIISLSGLTSLESIAYNLTIGSGMQATSLEGLESLEVVGGISIDDAEYLTAIHLPALTSVGTTLELLADNLESVTIDNLTSIGEDFTVKSNMLSTSSFNKLSYVGGTMTFNGGSSTASNAPLERIQFPSLAQVGGALDIKYWADVYLFEMPALEGVDGTITLHTWASLEELEMPALSAAGGLILQSITSSLTASFPALETLTDKLTLYSAGLTSFSAPELESVGGELYIYATCTNLTQLDFAKLSHIYQLNIRSTVMTGVKEYFPALTTVDAYLYLYGCSSFSGDLDVSGITMGTFYLYGATLDSITSITGDDDFDGLLYLTTPTANCTAMPQLNGFKRIKSAYISTSSNYKLPANFDFEEVEESLTFQSCTSATEINCEKLTKAGSIKFLYCNDLAKASFPLLESITGYGEEDAKTAGDFNYTVSSTELETINLPSLESVDGAFSVTSIDAAAPITEITLGKLKTIGGALTLSGTSATSVSYITNLDTFSTLESAGSVSISLLKELADFSGLKNVISSLDSGSWSVASCTYNPSYDNMVDGYYTAQ